MKKKHKVRKKKRKNLIEKLRYNIHKMEKWHNETKQRKYWKITIIKHIL